MKRIGRHFWVTAALVVGSVAGIGAQSAPPATLGDAIASISAQDYTTAITILDGLLADNPSNGRAWIWLGTAHKRNQNLDEALAAYTKAIETPALAPRATYQVGTTYALLGQLDSAFVWLERASATGRIDMTAIGIDQDAAGLREDDRYMLLFPSSEDFAQPFVEPARVIHEWRGEAANDQFGWIARNIGDVDGDGVDDLVTSAPTNNEGGTGAGKVYVYSSATGDLLWSRVGAENDNLGIGLEAAGDVNGDGIIDVVVGAPQVNRVDVFSGVDGTLLITAMGDSTSDAFGTNVSGLGDVNGDGHDDVLVGAPQNNDNGAAAGAAYVISGSDGRRLHTLVGAEAGDNFGSSVDGWANGDTLLFVVGAPNAGVQNQGAAYVFDGLVMDPAFVIDADSLGAQLGGMFVSVVGDVDGDGAQDVFASDFSHGGSTGRVYVHSGATGSRIGTFTGEGAGNGFGIGRGDAGDVDGDGHADLVIGAWQFATAAASGGKVYVYSGRTKELLHEFTGRVMGETLGFDTTGLGDVNGDGVIDYLLTSAWSAVAGTRSGRMYIVAGPS